MRTSAFFGPWDAHNFVTLALRTLAGGGEFIVADDAWVSPTYVPDLVNVSLDLLMDGESGVWHLANQGATTWADSRAARATRRLDERAIAARRRPASATRPAPALQRLAAHSATSCPRSTTRSHATSARRPLLIEESTPRRKSSGR